MTLQSQPDEHSCPLCAHTQANLFQQLDSFGYPVRYYQCIQCGFIFQDTTESKAADPDFYVSTYREVYQKDESPIIKDLEIQQRRAHHSQHWAAANSITQIARALDIGASAGILLSILKEEYACDVTGVEPGRSYREYAENHGIQMHPSLEDLLESHSERFDFITMMHVLEHLANPLDVLKTIRQTLLTSEGYILIEVPNLYAHDSYELAHLTCFTRHSLIQMLQQAGFEVLATNQHGYPVSKLLPLYLLVLARPAAGGYETGKIKPDRLVKFKRDLGFLYRRLAQKLAPHQAWLPVKKDLA